MRVDVNRACRVTGSVEPDGQKAVERVEEVNDRVVWEQTVQTAYDRAGIAICEWQRMGARNAAGRLEGDDHDCCTSTARGPSVLYVRQFVFTHVFVCQTVIEAAHPDCGMPINEVLDG